MKSVKPGRGPSFMGGIGAIVAAVFGLIWTGSAASAGAPGGFVAFGVLFVCMGIGAAVYNFKNATGKNRYSQFDITDEGEEPDPLNERFGTRQGESAGNAAGGFCTGCGAAAGADHAYCKKCGRKLD